MTNGGEDLLDKLGKIIEGGGVSDAELPNILREIIAHDSQQRSEDRRISWVDKVFGERGPRLYLVFIIMLISLLMAYSESENHAFFTAMIGLVGSCAGYMFGVGIRNGKS